MCHAGVGAAMNVACTARMQCALMWAGRAYATLVLGISATQVWSVLCFSKVAEAALGGKGKGGGVWVEGVRAGWGCGVGLRGRKGLGCLPVF